MAPGDTSSKVSRPKFDDMIVSVTRHQNSLVDNAFTCQFPLSALGYVVAGDSSGFIRDYLRPNAFADFNTMLETRLSILLTDTSIVWCLAESGRLGIVSGKKSLYAAVMDHQHAGERVLEFYAVKNSGMIKTKLEHDSSDN
jgi:hypothetical protein